MQIDRNPAIFLGYVDLLLANHVDPKLQHVIPPYRFTGQGGGCKRGPTAHRRNAFIRFTVAEQVKLNHIVTILDRIEPEFLSNHGIMIERYILRCVNVLRIKEHAVIPQYPDLPDVVWITRLGSGKREPQRAMFCHDHHPLNRTSGKRHKLIFQRPLC